MAHLNARDTTLAWASRAAQKDIERLKARMDWKMPWYTITDNFDVDFGVDQWHGHNTFIRDDHDKIFRTYFINNRGDEAMGSTWSYLDITRTFGHVDILVNNAAVLMYDGEARAHELPNEVWERTMNVNLRGYWLCAKHVIPNMLSHGGGCIILVASRTGLQGFNRLTAYSASKGGVLALMRAMAVDYAPDRIRVNAIVPGTMDTPMNAKGFSTPGAREERAARIPAGRLGAPDDISGMAVFLASDEAEYCLGAVYMVDGGATLT